MLVTDRDCQTGGARFAVPTLGEIEGKLLVSEVVATSCLRQLFAHADGAVMPAIKRRIRRSLETHCQAEKLCHDDTEAAVRYALQLVEAAAEEAGRRKTVSSNPGGCETIRRLRAMRGPSGR
ncbi:hypothetical protein HFO61_34070 [Rhizobium leguminosarum]|uniref:hypothetical protein n=1 Tax=Rhizobium leguminosarum TaxID=384 RepID=UPI001A936828|nr:hypothetical protein [Rhizobium leguminosarum]MBY5413425.1 hypothetical protein [Rhizobium leguminosarum]MBY5551733.1 hypothetical protein [Rhizobium leguminosarum]MBY5558801.1 hypothetical protein [Rhizobium leguminosarum]QSW27759.1 hypothetical protein J0664_33195 [Rhizobium leguminosarum]